MLVLDSSAVTRLAERSRFAAALIQAFRAEGLWPPTVPSVVLVECLEGHARRDAAENAFLKTCDIVAVSETLARRAAFLRRHARKGSAVDALVVAAAEPGGTVLTSDPRNLEHWPRMRNACGSSAFSISPPNPVRTSTPYLSQAGIWSLAWVCALALGACAASLREPPHCSVASCCPGGGYVYEPIVGCVRADHPPLCGCVCNGGEPYDTLQDCEHAVRKDAR